MKRLARLVAAPFRRTARRGNAVLFSLVIMGSALTASLGMATLVTSEISSVALIPPAERAYYKAESYIEQGLWEKKQDPGFAVADKDELPATFLCNGNCFLTDPKNQQGSLIKYLSTSSLTDERVVLKQDVPLQLDIDTAAATGATGRFSLGSIKNENGLRAVEVTVFAFPRSGPFPVIGGAQQPTPVLVDTKLFRPGDGDLGMNLGTGQVNAIGEAYPPLDESVYRLRIKALGADTEITPIATQGVDTELRLLTPDFQIQSVAEDGRARRGIEVIVPAVEQVASVFDYVIFSDLTLSKTEAKVDVIKSLRVTAYQDNNRNCTRDAGDTKVEGLPVSVGSVYTETTDSNGDASFSNMPSGTYKVTAQMSTGTTACPPYPPSVTFTDGDTNEIKQVDLLLKPPQRVPVYRFYNNARFDHFYTTNPCPHGSASTGCSGDSYIPGRAYFGGGGWRYEFIAGFAYNVRVPGTQPVYQAWHNGNRDSDHFYTMSKSEWDYWTTPGRFYDDGPEDGPGDLWVARRGIAWYMPPLGGGCRGGTVPFHRRFYLDGSGARNHLYSQNQGEASSWAYEGITGCIWTTRN